MSKLWERRDSVEANRKKIVYVDDLNFSLLSVKSRLGRHYEIYPAQSAEALFEILNHVSADLILLDINMPGKDGIETIKLLKGNPDFCGIPVIFLTANSDKATLSRAMGLGAADLVTKPFVDAELIERIEDQFAPIKREDAMPVILAVDDHPSILKSINELLHDQYKVYTLPKPEALEMILKKITPDLFLLDCKMPVLSGFDLIPLIRAYPGHDKTPIVFLTSEGDQDTLYAAIQNGISDFIVKPIDDAVLREKIAAQTADYRIRRQMRQLPAY